MDGFRVLQRIAPTTVLPIGFETRLYAGSGRHFEQSLYRYSLTKLKTYRTVLSSPSPCVSMSFSCNGRHLAKSNGSTLACILDPRMAQISMSLGTLAFEPAAISADKETYNLCLFSSTESTQLFTSSSNACHNILKLWDLRNTRQHLSSLCTNHGTIVTLKQLKSQRWLLYGHQEGKVCCWDYKTALKVSSESTEGADIQLDHELLTVKDPFVDLDLDAAETKLLLALRNGSVLVFENLDFTRLGAEFSEVQMTTNHLSGGYHHWLYTQGNRKCKTNQMFIVSPNSYLPDGQSAVSNVAALKFVPCYDGDIGIIAKVSVQQNINSTMGFRQAVNLNPKDSQTKSALRPSFTGPTLSSSSGSAGISSHTQCQFQEPSKFTSGPFIRSRLANNGQSNPMLSGPLLPKTRYASSATTLFSSAAKKPCRVPVSSVTSELDSSRSSGPSTTKFMGQLFLQPVTATAPLFLGQKMPSSMANIDSSQLFSPTFSSLAGGQQQFGGPVSSSSILPGLPNHCHGFVSGLIPTSQQPPRPVALPKRQHHSKKDFILEMAIDSGKSQFSVLDITSSNANNVRTRWYDTDDSYKPLSCKRMSVCSRLLASPSSKGIKVYMLPMSDDQMDTDVFFTAPKQCGCAAEIVIKHRSVLACSTPPTGEPLFAAIDADGDCHFLQPQM